MLRIGDQNHLFFREGPWRSQHSVYWGLDRVIASEKIIISENTYTVVEAEYFDWRLLQISDHALSNKQIVSVKCATQINIIKCLNINMYIYRVQLIAFDWRSNIQSKLNKLTELSLLQFVQTITSWIDRWVLFPVGL